jgi:hypothetical protein
MCPAGCADEDACTDDTLTGTACQAMCVHEAVAPVDGDACCPDGADLTTDDDCEPLSPIGTVVARCPGTMQPPTLAAGVSGWAVGCISDGSQQVTPTVEILERDGGLLASHPLLISNGYYYTDIQVSYLDGRFQTLYQYNCDDNGSWKTGWGWGCVDFREYDSAGTALTPSLVFGEVGHNGHPVLDWGGSSFGVGWVSYDEIYFRGIDSSRQLMSGSDPLANVHVGSDPGQNDDRDRARTKIVWDGGAFAIFSILGNQMYMLRADVAGTVVTAQQSLFPAYTETFSGQFDVASYNGKLFVVHRALGNDTILFQKISAAGTVEETTPVSSGGDFRYPQMLEIGGLFYVFTTDSTGMVELTVLDESATIVAGKSGIVGTSPMYAPSPAFDATTGELGIAYLDGPHQGNVAFARFTLLP